MKRAKERRRSVEVPAGPPSPRLRRTSRDQLRLALILLAGVLTYANSLSGPFIFDDRDTVLDNTTIRDLGDPGSVLSPPTETPVAGRPVVNATFAMNYAIGGLDVWGYHVVNVAIHLLCGLLLFGIIRRTLESVGPEAAFGWKTVDLAFASALIWTVHPLNSEVVNYLSQRSESLLACFYLLTLFASIRAMTARRRWQWEAIGIASCALGMACKESMVTAPVMILLYDRVFRFDSLGEALRTRWRFYAGLAATWLLLAALIATAPRTLSAGFSAPDAAPWTYLLNQAVMISRYLLLVVWPRPLVLYYGWPLPLTLGDVWPHALLILVLLALTVVALFRRPRLGFLGVWFFVTLAPTSSLVPITTEVGAERRMYLPLIALVVIGVIAAASIWNSLERRWSARGPTRRATARSTSARPDPFVVVAVAIAALLGTVTAARNREYRSSLTLAETTLERWPTAAAHSMFGTELAAAGRYTDAETHLRTAAVEYPPARYYLGSLLATVGKTDEAIVQLREFIRHQPPMMDRVLVARGLLGGLFMTQGKWPEAIEQYRLILTSAPADIDARLALANALARQQSFNEAIEHYRVVAGARPSDAGALGGLAIALSASGKPDEAVAVFRRVVDVDPRNSRARQNLAKALLDRGDVAGAAKQAQQGVVLAPSDPAAYELLGGILATAGRFAEARAQFERALQIDPASPARELLRRLPGGK